VFHDVDHPGPAAKDVVGHPAVDRARAAQHLVRTIDHQPERFARIRDEAVAVALRDGVALHRIAEALDVPPVDVQQMSRDHVRLDPSFGRGESEELSADRGGVRSSDATVTRASPGG
jgi:hypothetical protein